MCAMRSKGAKPPLSRTARKQAVLNDGVKRTTLSFYKYVRIEDPAALRAEFVEKLGTLGCLGRIYLAHEGINAQMNVPSERFTDFESYLRSLSSFRDVPFKIAVEEGSAPSFYKLTVKVRNKIVADGIDDPSFDPANTGEYLDAASFNEYIDDPDAVVVDMRNAYESEVGYFENAITPAVETFREELKVAPELLRVHKNKKIALYCTGGIRCEKASAWLKHNGFENVKHLKGGIIEYAHEVKRRGLPNRFHGTNFVFDERLGERVGDEVISHCHLCRIEKSDRHYHCKNQVCHVLFLACDGCREAKDGYCSRTCAVFDRLPDAWKRTYARFYNRHFRPVHFKKNRLRV